MKTVDKANASDESPVLRVGHPVRHAIMLINENADPGLDKVVAILSPFYRLIRARSGQEALQMIEDMPTPELLACIISDQHMPRVIRHVLFQHIHKILPCTISVILTEAIDPDVITGSPGEVGPHQFILKPFDANEFVLTIKRTVESFELKKKLESYHHDLEHIVRLRTQELVDKNQELECGYRALQEISITDPLTGLRNRRFLLQHLDADTALSLRRYDEWRRHGQTQHGLAQLPDNADLVFFMVDIDNFKEINDCYGHAAGDQVLIQMRQRLQEVFRESDYLVRWGGEEFLVVTRMTGRTEAEGLAERICTSVVAREFELREGLRIARTCSVGYACFPFMPNDPRLLSWSQIVDLADQAMYLAKRNGRNRWVGLYSTEYTPCADLHELITHNIENVIASGKLKMLARSEARINFCTSRT